ncbi:MAG: hypothetical protein QOJ38_2008 [Solirubrobacterales bacterium]|jgi:hypothetical protein|nr:hypothetical protein [Solirubrobacterales bacterium]
MERIGITDKGDLALLRQPVRLAAGSHDSPDEGVCIVELASLIGGEPFSDRPDCVCPTVGSFLRAWNDRAAHAARQRLVPYAERVVGSRCSSEVTHARRDLCLEWAGANLRGGAFSRMATRLAWRVRIGLFCGVVPALRLNEGAGEYAARLAFSRGDAESAFELLDAMLTLGRRRQPVVAVPVEPAPVEKVQAEPAVKVSAEHSAADEAALPPSHAARRRRAPARELTRH